MMHSTSTLYQALNQQLIEIDEQINAMKADLQKQIEVLPYPDDVTVYQMKNRDGSFVLVDMLAARAQIVSGMAALKAADVASKSPKGRSW